MPLFVLLLYISNLFLLKKIRHDLSFTEAVTHTSCFLQSSNGTIKIAISTVYPIIAVANFCMP